MNIIYFCFSLLSLFSSFSLTADISEVEEPIVVELTTEVQRLPLYLTHFDCKEAAFDSKYCAQLEKVLQFDLNYNGMTSVIASSAEKEMAAGASVFQQSPSSANWKTLGAFYVVKVKVEGDKLSLRLYAANAANAKSIDNLQLTGDLSGDRRLIHQLADSLYQTLFSASGVSTTKILYTVRNRQGKDWVSEVWEADYDGGNKRQLTREIGYAVMPSYMPPKNGSSAGGFFFVSYKTGQPKIYYQSLGDPAPRRLMTLRGNQLMPALSRQRDKIAFISDITGNADLFVQAFNPESGLVGKPYQVFSAHKATQGSPTFNPDGSQIAFVSNKDGSPRIYVMEVPAPGTSLKNVQATLLTKKNRESTAPAWSPDGKKIAYCSIVQGIRQIWIYDFTKNEERQLTQGGNNKENPTWAPDSLHLIFNAGNEDSNDLYLINLNQPDAVKITSGPGDKRFPSWEPRS